MKFCKNCGAELEDNAEICNKCGCPTELFHPVQPDLQGQSVQPGTPPQYAQTAQSGPASTSRGMSIAIKVFMVIGCVSCALGSLLIGFTIASLIGSLITLAWTVPMTVHVFRKLDKGEPIGLAFKICTLIFVNIIAGILLLVKDS